MPDTTRKEEIRGSNALIAEFLGGKIRRAWTINDSVCYIWTGVFVKEWEALIGLPTRNEAKESHILIDQLHFHDSWDWLMPVVEEISRMECERRRDEDDKKWIIFTYCPTTFGMLAESGQVRVRFYAHSEHLADNLIKATWDAVVDFIKSYNKQKQRDVTLGE